MSYPKYVCHKEVSAAKIASVEQGGDGSLVVHFEGPYQHLVILPHERRGKPTPEAGWYLVQYADGYISFSPAKTFEEGYTSEFEVLGEDEFTEGNNGTIVPFEQMQDLCLAVAKYDATLEISPDAVVTSATTALLRAAEAAAILDKIEGGDPADEQQEKQEEQERLEQEQIQQ